MASSNKQAFIDYLSDAGREGMDRVLTKLDELGFYEAPASTKFHLSCKGGLLEHSLNVYKAALFIREKVIKIQPELEDLLPLDSVAICALLHDVCKTDIYKESTIRGYLGYTVDYSTGVPLGHGEKSVIMLLYWGLDLRLEEMLAIRWHMNAWDMPMQSPEHKSSFNAAKEKTPLMTLIQTADGIASGILER